MRGGRAGTWLCEFLDSCAPRLWCRGISRSLSLLFERAPHTKNSRLQRPATGRSRGWGRCLPNRVPEHRGYGSDNSPVVVRIERPSAAAFPPGRLRLRRRCRTPSANPLWSGLRLVRGGRDGFRPRTDVRALAPGDRFLLLLLITPGIPFWRRSAWTGRTGAAPRFLARLPPGRQGRLLGPAPGAHSSPPS